LHFDAVKSRRLAAFIEGAAMALTTLGRQLHAARALLGKKQKEIAAVLNISTDVIWRAEHDRPSAWKTARVLRDLYTRNGVTFLQDGVQRTFRPDPPR
jgi:transcriptional regulator with XRE-family HTH domain